FLNVESIDGNAHLAVYASAIACVWVLQAALAVPLAVWNVVATYGPLTRCHIPFSKLPETLDYTVAVRVVAFFLPLGILWIGNMGVIYKLRRMDRKIMPFASGVTANPVRKRRNRKVTLTCVMLAIVFTVNLTPFQVALLVVQTATDRSVGASNLLTSSNSQGSNAHAQHTGITSNVSGSEGSPRPAASCRDNPKPAESNSGGGRLTIPGSSAYVIHAQPMYPGDTLPVDSQAVYRNAQTIQPLK
ncbi:opsin Gq1, partial [Elysia marginata]